MRLRMSRHQVAKREIIILLYRVIKNILHNISAV